MLNQLSSFPIEPVQNVAGQFNKAFHAKLFTLFASSVSEINTYAKEVTPHYKYCFCFIKEDEGKWFLENEGIIRVRTWVLDQCKNNPKKIDALYHKWSKSWDAYMTISEKINSQIIQKVSDKKFLFLFEEFYRAYLHAGSAAYICDSFMSLGDKDWLEELLNEYIPQGTLLKDAKNMITTLTAPVHLSFMLESEEELLKIAIRHNLKYPLPSFQVFSTKNPKAAEEFADHASRFHWMQNNYFVVKRLTAQDFYVELGNLLSKISVSLEELLAKKVQEKKKLIAEKEKLLSQFKENFPRNVVHTARLFSKWKDTRKAGVYRGMYVFDMFLEEAAKRKGYTKEDLTFVLADELQDVLAGKDLHQEIRKRKQQTFFAITPKGYFIASGKDADIYFACLATGTSTVVQLQGVVASVGKIKGRVRIIRNAKDMAAFLEGEILVTNQTTPEFVPVMKKAAAIVTEQGGITSHAAVISRELKVPCIIGTKIATSVLQNGETVEVDAVKGIVRRLR